MICAPGRPTGARRGQGAQLQGRGAFSTEQDLDSLVRCAEESSSAANAPISPIDMSVIDPDASPLTFTHTGLPLGVRITGEPVG